VRSVQTRREYVRSSRCVYCAERATCLDHIRPKTRGGTNALANLVPACHPCNSSKGSLLLTEWDIRKVLFAVGRDIRVFVEVLNLTNRYDLINGPLSIDMQIRLAGKALRHPNRETIREIITEVYESEPDPVPVRGPRTGTGDEPVMSLREMCDAGIIPMTYSTAKRARTRAGETFPPGKPSPTGATLYAPSDVLAWHESRSARNS
jgi:hypothetical protein